VQQARAGLKRLVLGCAWTLFGHQLHLKTIENIVYLKQERKSLTAFTKFDKVRTINSPFLFYKDGLLTPEGCSFNPLFHFRMPYGRD